MTYQFHFLLGGSADVEVSLGKALQGHDLAFVCPCHCKHLGQGDTGVERHLAVQGQLKRVKRSRSKRLKFKVKQK